MGIKERQEREREEKRELILTAAKEIIEKEGIDKLSIRKIANKIEYSPAIIYHYFKDKEEVIQYIMAESYKRIVKTLASLQNQEGEAATKLKSSLRKYIELALQMSEEYKTIMLNDSPSILQYTSVLFKGASKERQAIKILCDHLKENNLKSYDDDFIELTAQAVWSSVFGLIIRLLIERDIDEEQKHKLIDHTIEFIFNALKL